MKNIIEQLKNEIANIETKMTLIHNQRQEDLPISKDRELMKEYITLCGQVKHLNNALKELELI